MEEEIWKDIDGFEGYYQVSNYGRVKRVDRVVVRGNGKSDSAVFHMPERIKELQTQTQGYLHTVLYKDGKYKTKRVNRLVASAFIPNPENKPEVNHIDGNKNNNRVDNLEWVTGIKNKRHARKNGLVKPYKRPVLQIDISGNVVAEYESIKHASTLTGISSGNICTACKDGTKKPNAGGFYWRYKYAR